MSNAPHEARAVRSVPISQRILGAPPAYARGDHDLALSAAEESQGLARSAGYEAGVGWALLWTALSKMHGGRYGEALLSLQDGVVPIARRVGDPLLEALASYHLAEDLARRGARPASP